MGGRLEVVLLVRLGLSANWTPAQVVLVAAAAEEPWRKSHVGVGEVYYLPLPLDTRVRDHKEGRIGQACHYMAA